MLCELAARVLAFSCRYIEDPLLRIVEFSLPGFVMQSLKLLDRVIIKDYLGSTLLCVQVWQLRILVILVYIST